jgi:hypothetical protein
MPVSLWGVRGIVAAGEGESAWTQFAVYFTKGPVDLTVHSHLRYPLEDRTAPDVEIRIIARGVDINSTCWR